MSWRAPNRVDREVERRGEEVLPDRERWAELHDVLVVATRAEDDAPAERRATDAGDPVRIRRAGAPIRDELDGDEEPEPADLADAVGVIERLVESRERLRA